MTVCCWCCFGGMKIATVVVIHRMILVSWLKIKRRFSLSFIFFYFCQPANANKNKKLYKYDKFVRE